MTPLEKLDVLAETWREFRFACADRLNREDDTVCVNGNRPDVEYPCVSAEICPRLNPNVRARS